MRFLTVLLFLIGSVVSSQSQTLKKVEIDSSDGKVFIAVDTMPAPKGGMLEFRKWLAQNVEYPKEDREAGEGGKVFIQFIVEKDGSLSEIKVVPGSENQSTAAMQAEAIRVLKMSSNWTPGYQNGNAVRVRFVTSIEFKLTEEKKKKRRRRRK